MVSQVRSSARRVARVFIELFLENVWKPFNEAGRPEDDWPKVRDALERLRPLASEALLVIFQQVMSETVEEVTGREIQRGLAGASGSRGRRVIAGAAAAGSLSSRWARRNTDPGLDLPPSDRQWSRWRLRRPRSVDRPDLES